MNLLHNGVIPSKQFTPRYPFVDDAKVFGLFQSQAISMDIPHPWSGCQTSLDALELRWQKYFLEHTPNGSLIGQHTLFDGYLTGGDQTLLHITPAHDLIQESGLLYPSGGSLGSVLYCVPVHSDGTAHNLARFILDYELPQSHRARNMGGRLAKVLAITVSKDCFRDMNMEVSGMDHLMLGGLQLRIYDDFVKKAGVSALTKGLLENCISERLRASAHFLNACVSYNLGSISNTAFFDEFAALLAANPFFGYVYFEVLAEYALLHQNDTACSELLKQRGEINNHNFKKMIFEVSPHLLRGFRLIEFRPSIEDFCVYLERKARQNHFVCNFDRDYFLDFMKWRLGQVIRYKIMQRQRIEDTAFDRLRNTHSSLVGHMIRTEIARSPEIQDVAYIYDRLRAAEIRQFWATHNILFPYNAIIPKGEVGINPSYKGLTYKVHEATVEKLSNQVRLGRELDVRLATELVDPAMNSLRFQVRT